MASLLSLVTPTVFLVFTVARLALSRGAPDDLVQRYVCGFTGFTGLSLLVNAPPVLGAVGGVLPVEPVILVCRLFKTVSMMFLALLAVALTAPPEAVTRRAVRRYRMYLAAVLGVMTGLFFVAGVSVTGTAVTVHRARWAFAVYNLLFTGYSTACLVPMLRALAWHRRTVVQTRLRTGLLLLQLGVAVGTVWTFWGVTDVADVLRTGQQTPGEQPVATVLSTLVVVLIIAGTTVAWWDRILAAPLRWFRLRRSHRALEPLWRAMHAAVPEIAMGSGTSRGRPQRLSAEFALYRRVIEIHDAHLTLRAWVPAEVPDWLEQAASGTASKVPPSVREAARIAAALEMRASPGPYRSDRSEASEALRTVEGTIDAEVAWLVEVAGALLHSPVVADVRARARGEASAATRSAEARDGRGEPADTTRGSPDC
ncbi:MAB_1171c family putative transporter [Streptomyces sp. TP-A0874]|uniref:MAB_1171c family putative transporter n=1 Tax=Streptomyces sp. TP-A0874 TaxID=549819 RepID=UPI0008538421|nr:MAB_1171c family putative transporter [Streptomyces sp. TP-A0874]